MLYNWLAQNLVPSAIALGLSFIVLLVGSATDLKTREVPDFVNYGLVICGVALNLLFSIIYSSPAFIISSIVGLAVFFGIAYIMFYTGQWGGGDSKMIMGLGAMIGLNVGALLHQFLFAFLINALFVGALYGLLWSFYLALKNRKKFRKELHKILSNNTVEKVKWIILFLTVALLIVFFLIGINHNALRILVLSLAFISLTAFYMWVFVRAIEKSSMYKLVEPSRLTEGDWIVKDVYVNREYVTGPKDLGIEKKQIKKLIALYSKKKVGRILIKEGIPFVPSFFIAFIVTYLFGNIVMLVL